MLQTTPAVLTTAYKNAQKAFQRFWGANPAATVATRLHHLKTAFFSTTKALTIHYDPTDPDKAYVFTADKASGPGAGDYTPDIYFAPALVTSGNYATLGTNSAAGTIIHELSHLVLATVDNIYGMKSCSELSDADKVTNADNYKYYCELFQLANLANLPALSDGYNNSSRPPR
jgi:hypothetical protein